ncbi:Maltose/maltodextrin import ATP-binding protein MalK [Pseudovibrio axinellae]|uniref:Maltose/maltodextrin import ATP-binding protein MalK n=1 Tax=Pseudovibrio axinellae TaxID=989403 RepID=A0A165T4W4_9HYPH|nr:ABC transporter ATP-binding protein [Pseudovibrio axinellae]KZL05434.1 Maltose/maltodextrin import ATP-binding protein MalK [Pseudovibrio axinellae]SEP99381.1 carbohydrate ABC transporter ATP-binding protein, CUT1 family [Pseudovibrio axinellae]
MATLQLKNIVKSFGPTTVLKDVNLAIEDKEFVVFVGPSGCGKTTLLRIVAGLEEATQGSILIDDEDVSYAHPIDRGISMVFQSYALYPHLTVYENIAFPLRVAKRPEAEIKERVNKAASILQLEERLQFKPGQLSGGQRQRVAIGRSIVRNPKVFLFDEPLSNLDAALRGDMRVELSKLHRSLDTTMIYVTHDQVEAMTMADRIVVLNGGVVEQCGTPMDLYLHPRNKFVAGFIGHPKMNFIPAIVSRVEAHMLHVQLKDGGTMSIAIETTGLMAGDNVDVGIRPEHVQLDESGPISMEVDVLERLGASSIAYGKVQSNTTFCASLPGLADIKENSTINLSVKPEDAYVFNSKGEAQKRLTVLELA